MASRAASWLRLWLDPIVSPQLATVATMLLVAIFVLTNTVSADGSISGVYHASLQLAEQTSGSSNTEIKELTDDLKLLVTTPEPEQQTAPAPKPAAEPQKKDETKQNSKPNTDSQSKH